MLTTKRVETDGDSSGVANTGVSFEDWPGLVMEKTSALSDAASAKRHSSTAAKNDREGGTAQVVADKVFKPLQDYRRSNKVASHSATALVSAGQASSLAGISWSSVEGVTALRANAQGEWPQLGAQDTALPGLLPTTVSNIIKVSIDRTERKLNAALDSACAATASARVSADNSRATLVGERICLVVAYGNVINHARVAAHVADHNFRLEVDAWFDPESGVLTYLPAVEIAMDVQLLGHKARAWCLDARPGIMRRGSFCHCGKLWTPTVAEVSAGVMPVGACSGCRAVRVARQTALSNMSMAQKRPHDAMSQSTTMIASTSESVTVVKGKQSVGATLVSSSDSDDSMDEDDGPAVFRHASFLLQIEEEHYHYAVAYVVRDLRR